ncbi:hypothetical protein PIB30_068223 [Stylosanthes scabra]|uniref:Uncharacterized protein n=1 Tax=Stylosanthes scabra TaxID=79078 RepID=A0ABU6VPM1_9FABA|nr:hypothetical protein [Stylosanthes scabra]
MACTKSNPLAKGKTKAHILPLRASPRLAALRSRGKVQPQLQAPDDGNLEADVEGALPAAEGGAKEILPKNDICDALWAILDAESENEAEEIPGQWDLDSVLNNWGKVEPNMGPAGNYQGPHQ